jgi:carboxymethylenebutenolidase
MLRLIRNIFLGLLTLVLVAVVGLAALILIDAFNTTQRVDALTNVSYPAADGATLRGYLAEPEGEGPRAGVLVIHEFYGLNEEMVRKADLLAEQGYVVLAPDAYRGQTTALVPRAIWLTVTTSRERIAADIDAAYAFLAAHPRVDAGRTGAVGFCFGGTQALRLGTRNPALAANVIFYGSGLITEPAALGALGESGPVLGIFGETDNSIPLEEVAAFEQAMQARGIDHTVTVYPGVGHAFVNYEGIFEPGPEQQAWQQMEQFLAENLGQP